MNKAKKGVLTGASIFSIVASCFAILASLVLFLLGTIFTEELVKETYLTDSEYQYAETVDGYYFTYMKDGQELIITQDDIIMVTSISKGVCFVAGAFYLVTAIAKLVLAIKILINNGKDKYAKGSVIALLVFSILSSSIIEVGLLIAGLCIKNKVEIKEKERVVDVDDIELK